MKKLLAVLLALVPVLGFAYDVEVDGIYYDLVKTTKKATVTSGDNKYSGNVVIPSTITVDGVSYSVTDIGISAFNWCSSLTSIVIPSSVKSIGSYAFYDCRSLTSIEIPSSVTSIVSSVFERCRSLTSIKIPSSVTSIGNSAFAGCTSLTSIEIPSSVTSIDWYAFRNCSSLTSIEIPPSVTSIGNVAFEGCSSLTSIVIPSGVTSIEGYMFRDCSSLRTVKIPASVSYLYPEAFMGCMSLKDFYYYATELPAYTGTDLFDHYIYNATLHVPSAVINDFRNSSPWTSFGEIVPTDEDVIPQCEAPTISYQGGELEFTCATEDAQIHYEIGGTQASSGSTEGGKVTISTHITVTAYATANGYLRSETVEYQLPFNPGLRGDVNQDGEVNVADALEVSRIILENEGAAE